MVARTSVARSMVTPADNNGLRLKLGTLKAETEQCLWLTFHSASELLLLSFGNPSASAASLCRRGRESDRGDATGQS